ncbi:unnamed protein product [Porites lobata]|uniref:Uncharacterized protein n=1 Tax=Porites lobata TaxID=104759 RepID=A0ABN8RDM2_9CNID|nr:unnamed protein product [Porites lobata]
MFGHLLRRIHSSPVALLLLKRHASWTQGEGPNYSKNLIALGIATAGGVMFAFGYQKWKLDKDFEVESK